MELYKDCTRYKNLYKEQKVTDFANNLGTRVEDGKLSISFSLFFSLLFSFLFIFILEARVRV